MDEYIVIKTHSDMDYGMLKKNIVRVAEDVLDGFVSCYNNENRLIYLIPKKEIRVIIFYKVSTGQSLP